MKTVELRHGEIFAEAGSAVRGVYFPHSGVISLVVELNVGEMIETAMVGRDGVLNASSALDGKVSLNKAIVQLAGTRPPLRSTRFAKSPANSSRSAPFSFVTSRSCSRSRSSPLPAMPATRSRRMCRWLLRMRDLAGGDDLVLTQEFLAQMLGVRRPSVSLVANTLQKAGLIKYSRGNMRLLNIEGLKEGSCECYGVVKAHYDRMLSD